MTLRAAIRMLITLVPVAGGATSPLALQLLAKELRAERYTYVTKTGQLPEAIRQGLARQLEQRELQTADAGMSFNLLWRRRTRGCS